MLLIDEPSAISKRMVWVAKGDDEDWGALPDDVGSKRFTPNRLLVIVTKTEHQVFGYWMQARNHYYGDPTQPEQEMCHGTCLFEGEFPEYAPQWMLDARDLAVEAAKQAWEEKR